MTAFALYRLPYEQQVVLVAQTHDRPLELQSLDQLDGQNGFVVAPFAISDDCPLVIIRPDVVEAYPDADAISGRRFQALQSDSSGLRFQALQNSGLRFQALQNSGLRFQALQNSGLRFQALQSPRQCYSLDFCHFHEQLVSGRFSKLVLSRCATEASPTTQSLEASPTTQSLEASPTTQSLERLRVGERSSGMASPTMAFRRACELYPRLFIALVSTPQSGTWLTATPEVLLEKTAEGKWHTMALAGTMRLDDADGHRQGDTPKADDYSSIAWSEKNIEEQRLVASYIAGCLQRFSDEVVETGPRTVRAANLVHLRSDFHFTLAENSASVGRLLEALHPTPAVCGLPKDEAFRFILDNEHTPRRYYSGFMGPLFSSQLSTQCSMFNVQCSMVTHLFVSLRCMNITSTHYHLYAGGGLLKSSTEEQEWQETEAKMETMRRVYSSPSMSPSM